MASQIAIIRATLKYSTQEELITGMRPLISKRGLFIHSRTTRPVGSEVRFEFKLADGSRTYSGEGTVRKEVPFVGGPSSQKSGMLVALHRINRPFKEVVDAILDEADAAEKNKNIGKQFIVESRAGEPQGFDLFGDIDLDEGLDSLFSGIARKPETIHPMSGVYEKPMVVSGILKRPEDDEIELAYENDDMADSGFYDAPAGDLGERVGGPGADIQSRRATGEYKSATDMADAEREARAYEEKYESDKTDSYQWNGAVDPSAAEMQAALNMAADSSDPAMPVDDTVEMIPSVDGNLFGDALDFNDSPVMDRFEQAAAEMPVQEAVPAAAPVQPESETEEESEDPTQFTQIGYVIDPSIAYDGTTKDSAEDEQLDRAADGALKTDTLGYAVDADAESGVSAGTQPEINTSAAEYQMPRGDFDQMPDPYASETALPENGDMPDLYADVQDPYADAPDPFAAQPDPYAAMPDPYADAAQPDPYAADLPDPYAADLPDPYAGTSIPDPYSDTSLPNPYADAATEDGEIVFSAHDVEPVTDIPGHLQEPIPEPVPSADPWQDLGASETPSELFNALHADVLGAPSDDVSAIPEPGAPIADIFDPGISSNTEHSADIPPAVSSLSPKVPSHESVPSIGHFADHAVISPVDQPAAAEPVHSAVPASVPSHAAVPASIEHHPVDQPAGADPSPNLTLDSLLNRTQTASPAPRNNELTLEAVLQKADSNKDIIMMNVSAHKPAPRRREVSNEPAPEVPAPKKGGFFSNLFKH